MSLMKFAILILALSLGCEDETKKKAELEAQAAAQALVVEAKARVDAEARARLEADVAARVRAEMEAEAKRKAEEEAAAKEALKRDIAENPGKYLEAGGYKYFDKGFINSYRQLVQVTVENTSQYRVKELTGQVEWLDGDGKLVGASPVTLEGTIDAGDSMTFSSDAHTLTSGTIEGASSNCKVVLKSAKVLD